MGHNLLFLAILVLSPYAIVFIAAVCIIAHAWRGRVPRGARWAIGFGCALGALVFGYLLPTFGPVDSLLAPGDGIMPSEREYWVGAASPIASMILVTVIASVVAGTRRRRPSPGRGDQ